MLDAYTGNVKERYMVNDLATATVPRTDYIIILPQMQGLARFINHPVYQYIATCAENHLENCAPCPYCTTGNAMEVINYPS